jgi:hypothetical protein
MKKKFFSRLAEVNDGDLGTRWISWFELINDSNV